MVDGSYGMTNQTRGLFRVSSTFMTDVLALDPNSVHYVEQIAPNPDAPYGYDKFWDLTSAQESMGCPPAPTIEVEKIKNGTEVSGPVDDVYTASYTFNVTNTGDASSSYTLFDKVYFGNGIAVQGAEWTGPHSGSANGPGPFTLTPVTTQQPHVPIDGNATHTYTMNVKFTVTDPDLVGYNPETCVENTTLFNRAIVKDGASGSGYMDGDCLPPPEVAEPTFKILKRPAADQDPRMPGEQKTVFVGPNGETDSYYEIVITNNSASAATPAEPIVDRIYPPSGWSVTGVAYFLNGGANVLPGTTQFSIAPSQIGEIPAGGSKTIPVTVSWSLTGEAMAALASNPQDFVCESDMPTTTDNPKGLFNGVTMLGEDDPVGTENNQACVTPEVVPTWVEKNPRPGDPQEVGPDGSTLLEYTVTVHNDSAREAFTPPVRDIIRLPADVSASGPAEITVSHDAGVEVRGPVSSWNQASISAGANLGLADGVFLPAGATATFTIRIPVVVDVATADWDRLGTCTADANGVYTGGVPNEVYMAGDTTDGDDYACIPLVEPRKPSLTVNKVGLDAPGVPLGGAQFDVFASNPDGSINFDAALPKNADNMLQWDDLDPGTYYLVETQSPRGYSLLPQPIGFTIARSGESYTIQLLNEDDGVIATLDVGEGGYAMVVEVADVRQGDLPLTGPRDQAFWYALALAVGIGMVVLNLGLFRREQ